MKEIYRTQSIAEAEVLRALFESVGIEAKVHGKPLTSTELPSSIIRPSVWVDDSADEEQIKQIIQKYEQNKNSPVQRTPWVCKSCDEEVEGQFTTCWKCGQDRVKF